jgi:probable F420-dependent oxidoreductase
MGGAHGVRFSVGLFPYDRWGSVRSLSDAVRAADQLGFDAVALPEHLVMPVQPAVTPLSVVWYENFVLAAHLAALAPRIRFIFHALVVPYRHPVHLAKLVSTLDVVSEGRLTLVAGTGWLRGEFRILGVPYAERGERTDEYLRAMNVLWTEDAPTFEGQHVSFSRLAFQPRCVQQPHVPLWIGGSGPRPMERVVELGDGWAPMSTDLDELRRGIVQIREAASWRGRDPSALSFASGITIGTPDPSSEQAARRVTGDVARNEPIPAEPGLVMDLIARYREIGITDLGVSFAWETPEEYVERLEWFSEHVLEGG